MLRTRRRRMWDHWFFLAAAIFFNVGSADVGPFFQSSEYDHGTLGSWPVEYYRSTSVVSPNLNYVDYDAKCEDGRYALLAPRGASVANPGPMILDRHGRLVWTKHYGQTYNFDVQMYKSQAYLTFWEGDDSLGGHGSGKFYLLDSAYNEAYTVRGANNLSADLQEFHITQDQTALFTVYDLAAADLSSVGGPQHGWIWDGTFQEVDIETGDLLFEWRASEHCNFTESFQELDGTGDFDENPWDFFRISSVDKDAKGNYLVSASNTNSLFYVNGQTGDIIWRLGGKRSDFKDLSDNKACNFVSQHYVRFQDDDQAITLLDYAPAHMRGLFLDLNQREMTVKIRHEYQNTHHSMIAPSLYGSLQILDSGNVLIGYGLDAAWAEFTIDGNLLCEIHFGPEAGFGQNDISSHRIFKRDWVGYPRTIPDFAVHDSEAIVSWNGATEVSIWVLEGANEQTELADHFTFLTAMPKQGFETTIPIPPGTTQAYLRVRALDSSGNILGTTAVLHWGSNGADTDFANSDDNKNATDAHTPNNDDNKNDDHDDRDDKHHSFFDLRSFLFFAVGFCLALTLIVAVYIIRCFLLYRALYHRESDRERGEWKPVLETIPEDTDASDDDSDIEFSLLSNPRLSPRPDMIDPAYVDHSSNREYVNDTGNDRNIRML